MTVGATNGVNPYGTIQRHSATMRRPINNGFATLEQHPHNTLRYKVKCIRINGSLIIKYSGTISKRACFGILYFKALFTFFLNRNKKTFILMQKRGFNCKLLNL